MSSAIHRHGARQRQSQKSAGRSVRLPLFWKRYISLRKKKIFMAGILSTQRRAPLATGTCASGSEVRPAPLAAAQRNETQLRRPANARAEDAGSPLRTRGEIEATVCEFVSRFQQDYMGRGPKSIRAHLIGDLVVVRLQGVLTAAEQHLVKPHPAEKGRTLLKQVRTQLIETARPTIESLVNLATGVQMVSLHHDISTATGEEVLLFTLVEAPACRLPKHRQSQEVD